MIAVTFIDMWKRDEEHEETTRYAITNFLPSEELDRKQLIMVLN